MQCPVCRDTKLVMTDRQGVEIDYCPDCRGVWLDRGELDKIIERSAPEAGPAPRQEAPRRDAPRYEDEGQYRKKKKRESLLGELFNF